MTSVSQPLGQERTSVADGGASPRDTRVSRRGGTPPRSGWATLRSGWASLRWFLRGVLGGSAYDGYLAWHARHGHGEPLDEASYWRSRTDHQESHPQGRCC